MRRGSGLPRGSERDRWAALVARALWRRARRRLRLGPMYRWRFAGRVPDRVRIAPPDVRLADPQIAQEIYSSRFPLAGHLVDSGGVSPFQVDVGEPGWIRALHGFRWLRHLSAAGTDLAAANARSLVTDWMAHSGRDVAGQAWEPGITAKRVIAWLQHSSLILNGAELPFYRAFLASLATQVRYLRAVAPEMDAGKERLRVRIALAFASLSLPSSASAVRAAARHLDTELTAQILPDGGHISRNPLTIPALLADLLPLRQTYANQAQPPPAALVGSIDRMMQALRFFRHADGSLARFNGMGLTLQERINSLLRHDDSSATPLMHAPHSGYDRLALGQTVVIADTGAAPPFEVSSTAHAGCLSFELSCGRNCFIVNCGVDSYGLPESRAFGRATAAHSTATVNDTSQGRFVHPARIHGIIGGSLRGGAGTVGHRRLDGPGSQGVVASHDAYVPEFGLVHQRELRLEDGGDMLSGVDRFQPVGRARAVPAAIRFHIHPDIDLFRAEDGGIGMAARAGMAWLFDCGDVRPDIEESIFFAAGGGPRTTGQIVLHLADARGREVAWRFVRQDA